MLVPLILLSVGAVAAGFVFEPQFIGHEHDFWRGAIFARPTAMVRAHSSYARRLKRMARLTIMSCCDETHAAPADADMQLLLMAPSMPRSIMRCRPG